MKHIVYVLVGVIVLVVCYFAYTAGKYSAREEAVTRSTLDVSLIEEQMRRIAELATVSYDYSDIVSYSKTAKLWGYDVPFSTSKIILQYRGRIRAGVDLGGARITVRDTVVEIVLPEPRILSHDVDPRSFKILDQSNGLFSSIEIPDFHGFCVAHRDSMESVAMRRGLMEEARRGTLEALELVRVPMEERGWGVRIEFGGVGMGERE